MDRHRLIPASDLKLNLDAQAAPPTHRPEGRSGPTIFITGLGPWSRAAFDDAFRSGGPCPACGCSPGEHPRPGRYCLGCDQGAGRRAAQLMSRRQRRREKLRGGVG